MTGRERVLTALRREQPDRTPFDFLLGFTPYQAERLRERAGTPDPNEYFQTDARSVSIGPSRAPNDYRRYHPDLPPRASIDEWGVGHLPTESDDPRHSHLDGYLYPLRAGATETTAWGYPLPDIDAPYRYEGLAATVSALHMRGLAVVGAMACTLFEHLWQLRSMEGLLADFADEAPFATIMLDRIMEKRRIQARNLALAGVDVLMTGDDVSTQRGMLMSPAMWRRWLKPRLASVIAAAKDARPGILILYHSDGDPTAIIEDLVEIGVDVLNPLQPECMDTLSVKQRWGARLSFWGALGTQSNLPWGTPEDVRNEVYERISAVGKGGGLVLAPTHTIEPEVPWENIVAFVEAVRGAAARA